MDHLVTMMRMIWWWWWWWWKWWWWWWWWLKSGWNEFDHQVTTHCRLRVDQLSAASAWFSQMIEFLFLIRKTVRWVIEEPVQSCQEEGAGSGAPSVMTSLMKMNTFLKNKLKSTGSKELLTILNKTSNTVLINTRTILSSDLKTVAFSTAAPSGMTIDLRSDTVNIVKLNHFKIHDPCYC